MIDREGVVRSAYYNGNGSYQDTPEWDSLTAEEKSFYYRICSTVELHMQKEIDILRHRLMEYNLADAPRVTLKAKRRRQEPEPVERRVDPWVSFSKDWQRKTAKDDHAAD